MINPLDFIPRALWVAAVILLAAVSVMLKWDNHTLTTQLAKERTHVAELRQSIAEADASSKRNALSYETKAREAEANATRRATTLAADARSARAALDGLRESVSKAQGGFGLRADKAAFTTSLDHPDPFAELFLDCGRRYIDLAAKADGHANDAKTLIEAWPK